MNKNEQIIESLNRTKLLMGYKSSMTLTENVETLKDSFISESIILTEAPSPVKVAMKNMLRALFGDVDDAARAASISAGISDARYLAAKNSIDDAVKNAGGTIPHLNAVISSADDVIKALQNGTLGAAGVNRLKVGFLKSSLTGPQLRKVLVSQAATDSRNIAKYQGKTIKEITDDLINKKGFDAKIAKEIAKKLHPNLKPVPLVKPPKTKVTKNTKPPKKERIKEPDPILNKPTRWQTFKTKIVGMTKGKIFRYLLIAGGLYLAYKWWMDEGSTMFPDCISKNIPEEDFKKMAEQGLDYVLITDTGNSAIDKNGGGKFFDDKKFVTGNDKYTGTWDDTDSGIVITVGGTDYAMSCEGIEEETDDSGTDGSDTDDGSNTDNNTGSSTTTTTTVYTPGRGDYETSDL